MNLDNIFGAYTGVIYNAAAVVAGGICGSFLAGRVPGSLKDSVMKGIGLVVAAMGIKMSLETNSFLLVAGSMVLGCVVGELLHIEEGLDSWGVRLHGRLGRGEGTVAKGFVFASIVYCSGALGVTGALTSGLTGDHSLLFTKAALDGIASLAFASAMGVGVAFAFIPVLLYQGAIVFLAGSISSLLNQGVIQELTAVGGVLIFAIGLNLLGAAKIKVANFLPAMLFAVLAAKLFL